MNIRTTVIIAILAFSTGAFTQDNPLVDIIGGNELKRKQAAEKAKSAPKTRGFTTRGIKPGGSKVVVPPKIEGRKRTVIFSTRGIGEASTRGIAKAVSATDSTPGGNTETVSVNKIVAPGSNPYSKQGDLAAKAGETAYEMTYSVDPTSKLRGEIKFVKGKTEIADSASATFLGQLADAINNPKLAGFKFVIEGHASAEGSAEGNQTLSQNRANAIFDILTSGNYRVNDNRLLPVGYGESEARFPASAGENALSQDRRVLIYKLED